MGYTGLSPSEVEKGDTYFSALRKAPNLVLTGILLECEGLLTYCREEVFHFLGRYLLNQASVL